MIAAASSPTPYVQAIYPYLFDRIEVCGHAFTGPRPGNYAMADFDRPNEPVAFCLLGAFHCEFPSGPNLRLLAGCAHDATGREGFYGLAGARRLERTAP